MGISYSGVLRIVAKDLHFRQCVYSVFGGRVDITGEILHGKTSPLSHDNKGVYAGLPQNLPVTRYHSLAGTHTTLPDCLEVSSWIQAGPDGARGVIMGVRHKDLLVEGVQFHPESILTAEGRNMLRNFLSMRGGTWAENARLSKAITYNESAPSINGVAGEKQVSSKQKPSQQESILDKIYSRRREDVAAQRLIPSQRFSDLEQSYKLNLAPPQISFPHRLKQSPYRLSLMAEIKRASPSKGMISLATCAPEQTRKYALAGASVISVLTEPHWFKGSIEDLRAVRRSLEGMPNRPAVLRKEFVFDEYQILEARLAGADTVLLIVKMLDERTLTRLYQYSQTLGMEPLVEVNNVEEMKIAMRIGAAVIGVNNRDLTSFEVDLETTSRLMDMVPKETIVCALSGISGAKDVEAYQRNGVGAVLVGEALMRAPDTTGFVSDLLGESSRGNQSEVKTQLLVKICGTRTPEAAAFAIKEGADLIGMILAEGRKRCVPRQMALEISRVVHGTPKKGVYGSPIAPLHDSTRALDFFEFTASTIFAHPERALLVGVFQNQSLYYILEQQKLLGLDVVQLHGSEPVEWASLIPVPVIRSFKPRDIGIGQKGYHSVPLLDSAAGGSGQKLDIAAVRQVLEDDASLRVVLAGGLTAENVGDTLRQLGQSRRQVVAVDVSSGVEEEGSQSLDKIRAFIGAAKLRLGESE